MACFKAKKILKDTLELFGNMLWEELFEKI
jgi:hypothetical protein